MINSQETSWLKVVVKSECSLLRCVQLFVTTRTVSCQAPLSMGFSRQEYCSGLPFPSPRDYPDPEIESKSPVLQADSLPLKPPGKLKTTVYYFSQFYGWQGVYFSAFTWTHEVAYFLHGQLGWKFKDVLIYLDADSGYSLSLLHMVFDPSEAGKAFSHNIFRLTFSQCDSKTKKLLKVQTPNSQHFFRPCYTNQCMSKGWSRSKHEEKDSVSWEKELQRISTHNSFITIRLNFCNKERQNTVDFKIELFISQIVVANAAWWKWII